MQIIEDIALCESKQDPMALNPDDGGSRSVGYVQFKDQTFLEQIRRFGLYSYVEDEELKNLIWDKYVQKELMYQMLMEDIDNLIHWKNCSQKL